MESNYFKIVENKNPDNFKISLYCKSGIIRSYQYMAESMGLSIEVILAKIKEYNGFPNQYHNICFLIKEEANKFIEEYLEPQLVMQILSGNEVGSKMIIQFEDADGVYFSKRARARRYMDSYKNEIHQSEE